MNCRPRRVPNMMMITPTLKQQRHLLGRRVALLGDLVARSADFHAPTFFDHGLGDGNGGSTALRLLFFALLSSREIHLMLFALRVGEVTALVGVHGETESAFESSDVVHHEVGVLRQIDLLHREPPEAGGRIW